MGLGYTYRTVNNYLAALTRLRELGAATALHLTPRMDDPDARKLVRFRRESLVYHPIQNLTEAAFPRDRMRHLLERSIREFRPTHLLLDCTLNYPSNAVLHVLDSMSDRPIVVGFQQGMYQLWNVYDSSFPCDYFLCYGEMHRQNFSPQWQSRVKAVGLPKLDRLRDITVSDDGFLLFIAQDTPRPEVLSLALSEFSARVGLPVWIKPHPEHITKYDSLRPLFHFIDPEDDVVSWIARSSGVVTAGSTSGLEALVLRKPLVLLPGRPATAYEESWLVAYDFTGDALAHVWNWQRQDPALADPFLDRAIGGRRYDHADRVAQAIAQCGSVRRALAIA
jgi:hypothetical protein